VVGPITVLVLFARWAFLFLKSGLEESCAVGECTTDSDVRLALIMFLAGVALWLLLLAWHRVRKGRTRERR
jgi:hypothetical protein